jgi:hypothetical protein
MIDTPFAYQATFDASAKNVALFENGFLSPGLDSLLFILER